MPDTVESRPTVVKLAAENGKLLAKRAAQGVAASDAEGDAPSRFPKIRGRHAAPNAGSEPLEARRQPERARRTRRPSEPPAVDLEPAAEEAGYAFVPEGEYQIVLKRCVLNQQWDRWIWDVYFQVAEGPQMGVEIPMFLTRPPKEKEARVSRAWRVSAAYAIATGRRPPKNIARLTPQAYLANKMFTAEVVTVVRDQHGSEVPEGARYSKVKRLVRLSTGGREP